MAGVAGELATEVLASALALGCRDRKAPPPRVLAPWDSSLLQEAAGPAFVTLERTCPRSGLSPAPHGPCGWPLDVRSPALPSLAAAVPTIPLA